MLGNFAKGNIQMHWLQQILNMRIQELSSSYIMCQYSHLQQGSLYISLANVIITDLIWAENWPCLNTLRFPLIKRNYFIFTQLHVFLLCKVFVCLYGFFLRNIIFLSARSQKWYILESMFRFYNLCLGFIIYNLV